MKGVAKLDKYDWETHQDPRAAAFHYFPSHSF